MNSAWYKVVYPSHVKDLAGLVMTVAPVYRRLDDKKDFCVFSSLAPATAYFSPRAAELCASSLRLLADFKDIEVGECDTPLGSKLLRLEVGDPDCQSLLNLNKDSPEAT